MTIEVIVGTAVGSFTLVSGLIVAAYKVPIILTQHTERLTSHEKRIDGLEAEVIRNREQHARD